MPKILTCSLVGCSGGDEHAITRRLSQPKRNQLTARPTPVAKSSGLLFGRFPKISTGSKADKQVDHVECGVARDLGSRDILSGSPMLWPHLCPVKRAT